MAKELNSQQITFAEWLSVLEKERIPPTQKELAEKLGLSERTLQIWKKLPEIWQAVSNVNEREFQELVIKAKAVMVKAIEGRGEVKRVGFDAASLVVKQFGEVRGKSRDIVADIVAMYKKYNPEVD